MKISSINVSSLTQDRGQMTAAKYTLSEDGLTEFRNAKSRIPPLPLLFICSLSIPSAWPDQTLHSSTHSHGCSSLLCSQISPSSSIAPSVEDDGVADVELKGHIHSARKRGELVVRDIEMVCVSGGLCLYVDNSASETIFRH